MTLKDNNPKQEQIVIRLTKSVENEYSTFYNFQILYHQSTHSDMNNIEFVHIALMDT